VPDSFPLFGFTVLYIWVFYYPFMLFNIAGYVKHTQT